jgi:bacteriocin-like protein
MKKLSKDEMKKVKGGLEDGCDKATCEAKSNSTRTCVCTVGGQCVCVS